MTAPSLHRPAFPSLLRLVRRLLEALRPMAKDTGIVDKNSRQSEAALLLIDVINHFDFPDGKQLLQNAAAIVPRLRQRK